MMRGENTVLDKQDTFPCFGRLSSDTRKFSHRIFSEKAQTRSDDNDQVWMVTMGLMVQMVVVL